MRFHAVRDGGGHCNRAEKRKGREESPALFDEPRRGFVLLLAATIAEAHETKAEERHRCRLRNAGRDEITNRVIASDSDRSTRSAPRRNVHIEERAETEVARTE